VAELNASREKLTAASHKLAEAMYKANAATAGAAANGGTAASGAPEEAKKDEGVIDAEYVDVDEKK
jgi:molecular chaperone DnaK